MRGSKVALVDYLQENGSITSKEAFEKFGITRLAACIFDLRKLGYVINTVMMETTTQFGEVSRYAKYVYERKDK